jgi:hypothetical protein
MHFQIIARSLKGGTIVTGVEADSVADAYIAFYKIFPAGTLVESCKMIPPRRYRS